jgi:putative ABC transport system substrate-binding protein
MGRKNQHRRALLAALLATGLAPGALAARREGPHVVGYLSGGAKPQDFIATPLAELGYVEGRNLRFEVRTPPDWNPPTLAASAAELVAAKPDVIIALHTWRLRALAAATKAIPIVSMGTADPIREGLAQSLRRPGGNVTGLSFGLAEATEASVGLMRQLRPGLRRVALSYSAEPRPAFFEPAARAAGLEPASLRITHASAVGPALTPFAGQALFIAPGKDTDLGEEIVRVAHRLRILTAGQSSTLMSYGLDFSDGMRRAAAIIDKILRGANPAEIPFELPDRPYFRLDRRVARAIGVEVPNDVLLRVTELVD